VADVFSTVPVATGEVLEPRGGRNRRHPHASRGDYYRVRNSALPALANQTVDGGRARSTERHREFLERNFALLPAEAQRSEDEIYEGLVQTGENERSAAAQAHRTMAAALLAAGGTLREAADHAGVTEATVAGYWKDPDFRDLINQWTSTRLATVSGRVVGELVRRTSGKRLRRMDTGDVLRVFDRVAGGRSPAAAASKGVTVNVGIASFNDLLGQVAVAARDTGSEGADFPLYGSGVVPVPGGGAFRDGEVPGPRLGSPGGKE
jgi:hypothetical protein